MACRGPVYNQDSSHNHGQPTFALSPSFLSRIRYLLDNSAPVQGVIVAIENQKNRYYGLQYHPEVKHTDRGMETLKHFLFGIAKLNADWKLENILEEELEKLRQQVHKQLLCHGAFKMLLHRRCQGYAHNRLLTCHGCLVKT